MFRKDRFRQYQTAMNRAAPWCLFAFLVVALATVAASPPEKAKKSDASGAETRLILTREQLVEMVRLFLPDSSNEVRLVEQIDAHVNKIVELGFLRRVTGQQDVYEVRRILKAFVDGQWLAEFDQRLTEYVAQLTGSGDDE